MSLPLRPLRLLLLGAPGAGKGTQTSKLLKHFTGLTPISSGDLLRKEIQTKSEIGNYAQDIIAKGQLLPDSLISGLVINELNNRNLLNKNSSWLLDGFPRTLPQAKILNEDLVSKASDLNLVVELKVPERVILERIENRWVHVPSGRIYNLQYNPPKQQGVDDVTGEPLSKRPDDNAEVFQKRLNAYNETVDPLKSYYKDLGVLHSVEGETSDIIFPKLLDFIQNKFN
ncbi:Adenylate kinase [Wickerhamomyces ciferrii]|uniref:GTP:AMP phosphotransferase, mitochondrial n=1 Tax=Wickerhamomyces ciferrii (strain ATCC 14091 / BCRC 22168 / CBS 111 / JCM 3599 / NBRC 0793 / NRRL Y-1031 F-60-10) TaxID=1206466 RepID=K0KLJ9_WICCF|nr:Adenylate kinase [Wickerhamomyces ciferrii]CCH43092.1 Adenylate kinase [Wickerhamomyces ciferrii]